MWNSVRDAGTVVQAGRISRWYGRPDALWRAACSCGWRGFRFHALADHPDAESADGYGPFPPAALGRLIRGEWESMHSGPMTARGELRLAAEAAAEAQERLAAAVKAARAARHLEEIGQELGVSRQSAWERWRHVTTGRPGGEPMTTTGETVPVLPPELEGDLSHELTALEEWAIELQITDEEARSWASTVPQCAPRSR